MTRQFALVLIACLTITSCTSMQGATEAEFSFTFQSDAEGWTAGFADLPADFEPSIYELDSGYRPLPPGLDGNGLYILRNPQPLMIEVQNENRMCIIYLL